MFAYIYADNNSGRDIGAFLTHQTEQGINEAAINHISGMIGYMEQNASKAMRDVFSAIERQDVAGAIDAWNHYSTSELKNTITCHRVEPIKLVE